MPEILKFDDPVVLVGGGAVDVEVLRKYLHLPIVAADGGANLLREIAIEPVAVVGDLDSVEDLAHWRKNTQVIELEEQDTTDFEKCLYSTEAPYYIALGFTGDRFDHTLAALHVMQKWLAEKTIILVSGDDAVCVKKARVELNLPVGTRVSIYPLNRIAFQNSSGLKYPLDDLIMQSGEMIGTSNSCSEKMMKIVPKPSDGCFALILPITVLGAIESEIQVA